MLSLFQVSVKHLIPNTVYEFQVAAITRSIFTDREYLGPYSEPLVIVISSEPFFCPHQNFVN